MSDLISRQAAIDALNDIASELHERGRLDEEYIASWCAEKVEQLPPIQPKRGKWIYQKGMIKCDQCLRAIRRIDHDGLLNFCPHCGAKMEVTK